MRKLLCVLCVFVLFVFLLGANNSGESVSLPGKAIPGESFGAGKGISASSTDEPVGMVKEPGLKVLPKPEVVITSQASGEGPAGDGPVTTGSKIRAYTEVLDSFDLVQTNLDDCEWDGRYIYIIQGWSPSDSGDVIVFDPETGSIADHWTLPFMGTSYGVAFVRDTMYVSDATSGMIRKLNPSTHALISSFAAPGSGSLRGLTSDGTDLYMGRSTTIYQINTSGSVLDSSDISSFASFSLGLAYVSGDNHIWVADPNNVPAYIFKVDISGASAVLLDSFPAPNGVSTASGIAFDGSDLWYTAHNDTKLYRIDGGYSRSRIALFQDHEPWGLRSIKDILYDNGIPFKVFDSTDIGNADLSIYTKAIIPGQQDSLMGVAIADNKAWWENWISNGGVLQISGATYSSETWEGLTLPGDFSLEWHSGLGQNLLEIASSWHPIVNQPYVIDDDSLDNWGSSAHGWLTGLSDHYTVITDTLERPVLAIKRLGNGGIIATQMTLEYAWHYGYCSILENVIKYWLYGVSKNVLFALADGDQSWMRDALMARDSLIGNVDYMDARDTIAKVEDFLMYDVVLTYPNSSYFDTVAMGDTLAAFVDLGGRVILGAFCWYRHGNDLRGAIMDASYNPFYSPSGGNHFSSANLGWNDAGHSMMDGVSNFSEDYRDSLAVNTGADTVAKYDDGEYLLGYKIQPSEGIVVGFNVFPSDTLGGAWNGQGVKLTRNIINWSASYSGIEDVIEVGDGLAILEMSSPIMTGNEWISLSIDSPGSVELRIINIAGMIVSSKSLNYTTPGVKRVEFDVSELPSGAYFLALNTSKGKAIRKALVIR